MKLVKKAKKGFTIVELVIVIGVIGILSAILIPTFVNVTKNAEEAALQANLAQGYSMYAAEMADGYVDGTSPAKAIAQKSQYEVVLKFNDKKYAYNTEGKWIESDSATTTLVVAGEEALSTFNKVTVYVL